MNYKVETENFLKDLERVAQVRVEVANYLEQMAETIELAELEGKISSGGLGLNSHLEDMKAVENNLRQGVFRFLVLENMKQDKSTFLNALLGENLLSSNINSCTAVLTILRYGKEKKVTVYFNDDTKSEQLDFQQFIQTYTLDPSEAKQLEQDDRQAFPNVSYAVVEYPLPLLEKGIEIIDSPGLNEPEARLEGTGFPEFLGSLNTFLTKERAIAQLRQARTIACQAYTRTHEAIERRIPLLAQDVDRLKRKINSVEPEFKKLTGIRDRFQQEIRSMRDIQAKGIADSFRNYILNLGNTFETDFPRDRLDLKLFDFLSKNKRDAFNAALKKAFEQYINDKLSNWTLSAEKNLNTAFNQLTVSATRYGESYSQITDEITEKITEQKVVANPNSTAEDDKTPTWTKWAMGLFSLTRGNLAEVAIAGAGFDWKNSLFNYVAVIGIGNIISAAARIFLEPTGLALIGLGVGFVQADRARQELVEMTEKELIKHLPQLASEQWLAVYNGVKEYFDAYEREVTKRIDDDITSRKSELDNLVKQKETFEINRDAEVQRLQKLNGEVAIKSQQIERIFQKLSSASA
ncbi:MAG: Bacterial dynamin-like protein [Chroococcidiopsis sp. SAG 2025]|uniref:dynamin family protein n=1 Tax=Chroococcidiopsis sp. SAG 2025 TaxID=171389 RepID=UPI002937286E|nr:dynamin family protein [Chroococcidiopsis sp. SAG 2025]MDV2995411.1 Bacterial dynamin-like protein [Chroococcidiopsis sp. SAG 2025]